MRNDTPLPLGYQNVGVTQVSTTSALEFDIEPASYSTNGLGWLTKEITSFTMDSDYARTLLGLPPLPDPEETLTSALADALHELKEGDQMQFFEADLAEILGKMKEAVVEAARAAKGAA